MLRVHKSIQGRTTKTSAIEPSSLHALALKYVKGCSLFSLTYRPRDYVDNTVTLYMTYVLVALH